ncbi:MAG: division/cell wall cluster transcriptional repressor MraZ [Lachnospiraceae bacterium]|nr:division/cell wall cluster transcriptional repressor MraZ [Lachnospiraceae bacterium]MBQ2577778.1 division/cell wall cluster transcriptional repressor MraZ [Lachnospiraceae bacterium]MCR4732161.1 division/cell wall cluster transcriptional repressor MraZ [Lachnospiraceae bacterium]MEE3356200.1 division/cell wall cluster transcriptional repressor MraZ [Candidatus Weimeria sp.]
MFMGEYSHTIDPKGRLIVPAKFREQLGSEFVLTKGLDGCLYGYSYEEWHKFEEHFQNLGSMTSNVRKLTRFFFASACNLEIDKQGRVLIPANLREFAGLSKDVVLAGNLNRIEVWDKQKWDEANTFDDIDEVAESFGEMGLNI